MIIQIEIQDNNLQLPDRQYYNVGLNGKYKAKLTGITYADQVAGTSNRVISIRSDCFKTLYGRDIKFLNQAVHVNPTVQGEFKFIIEAQAGQIDIQLTSNIPYDGSAQNIFDVCILTFDVDLDDNKYSQEYPVA
jgi:hypothetical protein